MSDLQCPAVVLLVPREALASPAHVRALATGRLAGVFVASSSAADPGALEAARELATAAGSPIEAMAEGGEGAGLREAVASLADLYRGETVAVVAEAALLRDALGCASLPTEPIALAVDASGWTVIRR